MAKTYVYYQVNLAIIDLYADLSISIKKQDRDKSEDLPRSHRVVYN